MSRPPLPVYLEACAALAVARVKVTWQRSASHFSRSAGGDPATADEIAVIRRTIAAAGRRLPFRTKCYEDALAAQSMLARRGRSSRLHFGGRKSDGALTAHVWLTSGENIVVGGEEAEKFANLASSPET